MYQRLLLPLVLSLALLVSQQLGFAHAMSHLASEDGRPAASEAERSAPGAPKLLADGCVHCPAYAQLAFALTGTARRAPDVDLAYARPTIAPLLARGIAAPVHFQSRAPPRA